MYNHEGYVAEATGDNVFIVAGGVIYAPPVEAGALGGITRSIVIKLAGQENIQVVEKNLTRFDLYVCDEFFLTLLLGIKKIFIFSPELSMPQFSRRAF